MLGYDDELLARVRARRRRRLRPVVVVLELLLVGLIALPVAVVDLVYRPGGVQPLLDRALRSTPVRLVVDDLLMLPVGAWTDWRSWRLEVRGLAVRPRDPKKPDFRIARGVLPVPERSRDRDGILVLTFQEVDAYGLVITAHQQRPPPAWEPVRGVILRTPIGRIHGASWSAPDDEPLKAGGVEGITGTLRDVIYDTGRREVTGTGTLAARSFRSGNILLTDLVLPRFDADHSTLGFEGTADFAGTLARIEGTIATFHIKPAVTIRARLKGAELDTVIRTATNQPSPVEGVLELDLSVFAGGTRPRGGALMTGSIVVTDGGIQLPRSTRYVVLDALRILPWVDVDASNKVRMNTMKGRLTLTRGTATFQEVTYPAGKRTLRLDGMVKEGRLHLVVRLLPVSDPDIRPGLGVVIEGSPQDQSFRLARREDLLKPEPWRPFEDEAERRKTEKRLDDARRLRRSR